MPKLLPSARRFQVTLDLLSARCQLLLLLAKSIFEETSSLDILIEKIMTKAQGLLHSEKCRVYLTDTDKSMAIEDSMNMRSSTVEYRSDVSQSQHYPARKTDHQTDRINTNADDETCLKKSSLPPQVITIAHGVPRIDYFPS